MLHKTGYFGDAWYWSRHASTNLKILWHKINKN